MNQQQESIMSPELIHRILLAGPDDFASLQRSSGRHRKLLPAFGNWRQGIMFAKTQQTDPGFVLKRAYHDSVLERVQKLQTYLPIWEMLLELHNSIRTLIPNRTDLHEILIDQRTLPDFSTEDDDDDTDGEEMMLSWIREAALALEQLESPEQAISTKEWISKSSSRMTSAAASAETTTTSSSGDKGRNGQRSFLISSIQYLIDKASICKEEMSDFYLTRVVAPKLYSSGDGLEMERTHFGKRFGRDSPPPNTRKWISNILDTYLGDSSDDQQSSKKRDELRRNPQARQDLITTGWIEAVLFHQTTGPTILPEIFHMDMNAIHTIRSVTKIAAAGCALGLQSCQTAKCNDPGVLMKSEARGESLVKVLSNRSGHSSIEEYEQSVQDVLINLSQSLLSSDDHLISNEDLETLRGRVRSVLRGEDTVLKLLDKRVQTIFCELGVDRGHNNEVCVPPMEMRTGRGSNPSSLKSVDDDYLGKELSPFLIKARQKFTERGLAFYASDLAKASLLAIKVSKLAYLLYGDQFLDEMILDHL